MRGLAALLLLAAACAGAQTRYPVDWKNAGAELLDDFITLVKIDTSNPPGNETAAAKAIEAVLKREGIPVKLFALDPGRANLVARIPGSGSKRPLLLMGHTDVVGVERERWSFDPFAAIRRNGIVYGRGTTDDKSHVAAAMTILMLLHRMHVKLDRDVIFLAEAGEEGTTGVGIDYMVRDHWPEIEAEYALAEGGSIVEENGRVHHVLVTTTEKVPRVIRLVAHGPAGHGSRPVPDNAVVLLARAVARAGTWQTPLRLNATTRAYFGRLAAISPLAEATRYLAILDPARAPEADRYFQLHDPGHYSILRTSVVPTILKGGFRTNVIPSQAEADLDVRLLPDENFPAFMDELRRVIGDARVEAIPLAEPSRPAAPPSRLDTEMYRALEAVGRRMFGAPTIPAMLTGATDNAQLRARGVQAYGVGELVSVEDGPLGGAHSDDERLSVRSLETMTEFLWNAVLEVAAR